MPFDAIAFQPIPARNQAAPMPFRSAEQAWFWASRALAARRAGRRWQADDAVIRACTPDEILRCLDQLYRARQIDHVHAHVLRRWGERGQAPDRRRGGDRSDYRQWREALNRLEHVLRERRIVAGFDLTEPAARENDAASYRKIVKITSSSPLTYITTTGRKTTEANRDGSLIAARVAGTSRPHTSKFLPLAAISPPNPDRLRVAPHGSTLSFLALSLTDSSTGYKEI